MCRLGEENKPRSVLNKSTDVNFFKPVICRRGQFVACHHDKADTAHDGRVGQVRSVGERSRTGEARYFNSVA